MKFKQIEKELKLFAHKVIEAARKNLKRKKKITTGQLYKSLTSKVVPQKDSVLLQFKMEDYGVFVDRGVKGKDPSALPDKAKWKGVQRAPNSPYQFGSMKSRGLRGAINMWTVQKGVFDKQIRNKKGQFIPRKSLQFMMSRSIYLAGLEATMFFTDPYNKELRRFAAKFFDAFIIDIDEKLVYEDKK
tara:strand:- start:8394 stop:8954 length:561 start_codon:yes stop_codon:yes gene_type:complete